MLHDLFPAVLALLKNRDLEIACNTLPFLMAYSAKWRATLKRGQPIPEASP